MGSWLIGLKRDRNAERNNNSPAGSKLSPAKRVELHSLSSPASPRISFTPYFSTIHFPSPRYSLNPLNLIMKTSTLVAATAGTVLTGLLGKAK